MASWKLPTLLISTVLCLKNAVEAQIPSNCADASDLTDNRCQEQLEDITVITPGELVFAKLQCYGCPTIERFGFGNHKLTHEDNALLFNISLSTSRKALLINDIEVFPSLTLPPKPNFLAYQIPLNYNVSSLSSTIACANSPCREYDGRCACVEGALGADAISFDFAETKSPEDNAWTVYLDAIGGHNGYLVDPYVEFIAPEQRRLAVYIQSDALGEALEIVGAKLVEREHVPIQIDLLFREKLRKFFGVGCGAHEEPGHVVYRYLEWDDYGKIGTLKHFLLELKGEWPWNLIAIIVGSTIIGLAIIFRIYKFSMEVRGIMIRNNKLARGGFSDEGDKEEGEGLLDSAEQGGNP